MIDYLGSEKRKKDDRPELARPADVSMIFGGEAMPHAVR
jgi:hypothetical protein